MKYDETFFPQFSTSLVICPYADDVMHQQIRAFVLFDRRVMLGQVPFVTEVSKNNGGERCGAANLCVFVYGKRAAVVVSSLLSSFCETEKAKV